jgi:molybdate transport system substrate-binding protein
LPNSLGVAVRAGTQKPDVSTVEAFKQVMLKAKTVAIPGSTSGIWLLNDLFPRLGIAEKINAKVTPRGTDATGLVAAGGADLVVMPVSEIMHAKGVEFAGRIALAQIAERKYCRPQARPFRLGFPRKVPMFPICPPAAL